MVSPITPKEVKKLNQIPDEVFVAFNELIAKNFTEGSARVSQEAVTELIKQKMQSTKVPTDFLNVEPYYRKAGWVVTYASPDRGENFSSYFIFKSK